MLFFGFNAAAQATETKTSAKKFSPSEIVFPEIEGWKAGAKGAIPMEESGVSINYDSPERERITVYVYKRGQAAKDLKGVVKEEFDGALDALSQFAEAGLYSNLKIGKKETTTVGGSVQSLKAGLGFEARGAKYSSELFVFPYQDHVVKIRASRPDPIANNDLYSKFLIAIDKLFSK
jgi:hypothetical protein